MQKLIKVGLKACSSSFHDNKDEDLKVIDVTPIESSFSNINLDKYGTRYESTLARRHPNDLEFIDLDAKIDKSGIGEVKYCISLLQSVLNSPHAYNQNKPFTKHIVDAMVQSFEEKLDLEVSIPRKLYDEWEPTIKIKIKDYECHALCDSGASISRIPKTLCDVEFSSCL